MAVTYQYHTVQKNESLSKIAPRYGVTWQSIASLNGIRSPYTIHPGQKLKVKAINSGGSSFPAPGKPSPSSGGSSGGAVAPGGAADISFATNALDKVIGGIILYGIFKVAMKVF